MNILFYIIIYLFSSSLSFADYRDANIQSEMKEQYAGCYESFVNNLETCAVSSCSYPDISNNKVWKAHVINGIKNDSCYIIYYSYLGSEIIDSPEHCFYNKQDQRLLFILYQNLFSQTSAIEIADIKTKIIYLNNSACTKNKTPDKD